MSLGTCLLDQLHSTTFCRLALLIIQPQEEKGVVSISASSPKLKETACVQRCYGVRKVNIRRMLKIRDEAWDVARR